MHSAHKQIRFDLLWDAPESKLALQSKVKTFLHTYPPLPESDGGYALSHYTGNIHVLPPTTGLRLPADFPDSTSNTVLMGEVMAASGLGATR